MKLTVLCPAGILTVAGVLAAFVSELVKVTMVATETGAVSVTVPVTTVVEDPCTAVGLTKISVRRFGVTVML